MLLIDKLAITPHKDAPLFDDKLKARSLMIDIMNEMNSPNFNPNAEARELIKQFAIANLWFMEKFICGWSGPYNRLNEDLHIKMANWRQSAACMGVGARGAGFIFRGGYKSTIWGHGSLVWEIVRDRNISIRYSSSRIDKAEAFVNCAKDVFTSNDLFKYLFPEFIINPNKGGFITPARTRTQASPTVKPGSTGGASAGDHHNLHIADDLIDEQDLNAENMSTVEMYRKIEWFKKTEVPLLIDPATDRYLLFGTRYSVDDLYSLIWNNCKSLEGYQGADCQVDERNKWDIYYRKVIEDGKAVIPETFSIEFINKLFEDDPWTAMTQYYNDPKESGLTEFSTVKVPTCRLYLTDEPYITVPTKHGDKVLYLKDMRGVLALDPAFTYKKVSPKSSRTALAVCFKDFEDNCYLLEIQAGYWKANHTYDVIFDIITKYKGHIRGLLFENNAQQKILEDTLLEERKRRGIHVALIPEAATTDKDARIRSGLGNYLGREALFLTSQSSIYFLEELRGFPMARKKDVLDASEKAMRYLRKPQDPVDVAYASVEDLRKEIHQYENVTGY